jgi:glycosyltransferase involved in cell wall biosynthesis
MSNRDRTVSVIIPTLAHPLRANHLRRAVHSVLHQHDVEVVAILVINGSQFDQALVDELRQLRHVEIVHLPSSDLPSALREGRRRVSTPWYSELDDDDLLLPNALAVRLDALVRLTDHDAVVTNGVVRASDRDKPFMVDFQEAARNPLGWLATGNWLSPGATLFRTDRVPETLFDGIPRYLEWTYLAVRLATSYRLLFINEPTFVYHVDSPLRTVDSEAYLRGQPAALRRILQLDMPKALRATFRRRLAGAHHEVARNELHRGRLGSAWMSHLHCITQPSGWRYLPFTRRLITTPS